MVLAELSQKITRALYKLQKEIVVNDAVIEEMIVEICNALLSSDVNIKKVITLRKNIKENLKLDEMALAIDRRREIRKIVFNELVKMLDPGVQPWKPQKGKTNIIMLVGLQGNGKTTTATKMATYYKRKGFYPALVCCDTFRAGAFVQLSQLAMKAKIPYYGNHFECPVKIAQEGVEKFKEVGKDIIIIDTSGRHKQEASLFEEMEQISNVIKPHQIVFVMDGSIGQAALDQAQAFKEKVDIGAVIITKLDGHAKGGGALSAVAATESPIIFIGTGEDVNDLQEFEVQSFVSRLLGMGDKKTFIEMISKNIQPEKRKIINIGKFNLRDMYDQFQNLLKMGPLDQVIDMLPIDMGLGLLPKGTKGEAGHQKIKAYMTIMDSMTDEELNVPKVLNPSRINRIARGSGHSVKEVNDLLVLFKQFECVGSKLIKMKKIQPGRMNHIPPHLLEQLGGATGLNSIIKQMGKDGLKY